MKHFKIKTGYNESEFIPIDESELDAAIHIFITESKGVFKNGVVRGKDIIAITEDWHKEMGWYPTYKMQSEDWEELKKKGITKKYQGVIGQAKEKVSYLVKINQLHLLGKEVEGFTPSVARISTGLKDKKLSQ